MRPSWWFKAILAAVVVASGVAFWVTRDQIPNPVRFCAGTDTGFNHQLAKKLADTLHSQGTPAVLLESKGSRSNRDMLLSGQADLAVLKLGSVELDGLEVIAPIYPDTLMIVVRQQRGIHSVADLRGRRVILGRTGSGTREMARSILQHYRVDPDGLRETNRYFGDILKDATIDAAFVSTALTNPDLEPMLASGQFEILPLPDAAALCVLFPYFHEATVPLGLFRQDPPLPPQPVPTVATTALLVGTRGSSPKMIAATLNALYDYRLLSQFPTLYSRSEGASWTLTPIHSAARDFFDPYRGLGTAANMLESLSAIKELFVGIVALLWLFWERYRRQQEVQRGAEFSRLKERLDVFIEQAVALEKEALTCLKDPEALESLFARTSQVKLEALNELTHEELRSDRGFSILMSQCGGLMDQLLRMKDQAMRTSRNVEAGPLVVPPES